MTGIRLTAFKSYSRIGYCIQLIKSKDNKLYRIDIDSISWIECHESSHIEPLVVDSVNAESEVSTSSLSGENQALKNEIKFLREQIAKLLEKK